MSSELINIECDACDNDVHTVLFYKNKYPIIRCIKCSIVSTHFDSSIDLSSIYDDEYFKGGQDDGYLDYVGSEQTLKFEFSKAVKLLTKYVIGNNKVLLDIGCAYGFFLDEASEQFKVYGLEIATEAAEYSLKKGHEVVNDVLNSSIFEVTGKLDVVTMFDVIEHLPSPSESLDLIYENLRQDGIVMITTGNVDSMLSKIMGKKWRLMTPPQHTFYFSKSTLISLLEAKGFKILHCDMPWKMVPFNLAMYQLGARIGYRVKFLERISVGVPVNLFDTIRIIAQK